MKRRKSARVKATRIIETRVAFVIERLRDRVSIAAHARGMTLDGVARRMRITKSALSFMMVKERVGLEWFERLSAALGMTDEDWRAPLPEVEVDPARVAANLRELAEARFQRIQERLEPPRGVGLGTDAASAAERERDRR